MALLREVWAFGRFLGGLTGVSLVWLAWETLRVELLYATLKVIALFGIALTGSVMGLRRALVPWQIELPSQR